MKYGLLVQCTMCVFCLSSFAVSSSSLRSEKESPSLESNANTLSFDGLKELAQKVLESRSFNSRADYGFSRELRHLLEDKLQNGSALHCQNIVREALGDPLYHSLETLYLNHIESADVNVRSATANTLGSVLFSMKAVTQLERLAFNRDKRIQLGALEALMCLDHPGCSSLVRYAILSGDLPDIVASRLLETRYMKDNESGKQLARELCHMLAGPSTVKAALPMLEGDDDYSGLVRVLLLSGRYDVPEKPKLDLFEQTEVNLLCKLMWSVVTDTSHFEADEEIKTRLRALATSVTHERLYRRALLVLEHLGENVTYFEAMRDSTQTPLPKKKLLDDLVLRLKTQSRSKGVIQKAVGSKWR